MDRVGTLAVTVLAGNLQLARAYQRRCSRTRASLGTSGRSTRSFWGSCRRSSRRRLWRRERARSARAARALGRRRSRRLGLARRDAPSLPQDLRWLDGAVHVLHLDPIANAIRSAGAGEFVTFEDPVVAWDSGPVGLIASFSMSPTALVLVTTRDTRVAVRDYPDAALRHLLKPESFRENVICRTKLSRRVLAAAGNLRRSGNAAR